MSLFLSLLVLFVTLALCAATAIWKDRLREGASDGTKALSLLLFTLPMATSLVGMENTGILVDFWGPVFGQPVLAMIVCSSVVGVVLTFALSFDLKVVELGGNERQGADSADPGTYV